MSEQEHAQLKALITALSWFEPAVKDMDSNNNIAVMAGNEVIAFLRVCDIRHAAKIKDTLT